MKGRGLELHLPVAIRILLYPKPKPYAGCITRPEFFRDNIEETVDELVDLGLRLGTYDLPDLKTDKRGMPGGRALRSRVQDPLAIFCQCFEESRQ